MNLKEYVKDEEIIEIAKNLIAIKSDETEDKVAYWIKEYLNQEGIPGVIDEVEEGRLNVYGEIKGVSGKCGLMLNGHLDTVPGINMDFEPYTPFIKNGKLYGRGSCDMKGGIAAELAAITAVKRANIKLNNSVMFTGIVDEERRSIGAEKLIKEKIKADFAVVAEPTNLQVLIMLKGVETIEVTFHGKAAHGSIPKEGINAIYMASEFIRLIQEEIEPEVEANKIDLLGSGSICASVIHGGHTANAVADLCTVTIDRRWLPNETLESIYKQIDSIAKKVADKFGGKFESRSKKEALASMGNIPYMIDPSNRLVQEALKIVEKNSGEMQEPHAMTGWADAALLSHFGGMDCIILGPGAPEKAHTSDEYNEIDQLIKATNIYIELIEKFCIEK